MKVKLLICIALLISYTAYSSTYYVSTGGLNNNVGSILLPWKTLQYASDEVKAGDTVIVKPGNYAGFVLGWDDSKSGIAGDPIVFKAEPGATITSKNNTTADGINLEGSSYIVIDGFTITNTGGSITRAGIRSVTNTDVVIRNNTISGMGIWAIFTGFSNNILIENNRCSNSIKEHGIYFSNSGDNPIIRNNISFSNNGCGIHMNGDESQGEDGIISNALVEGNIIYNNGMAGGSGINCDGVQNSVIRNNLLYDNHASGISLYKIDAAEPAKDNLIISNTIYMASDGGWAINITDASINNKVLNNILFTKHNYRGGLDCESNSLSGFQSDYNVVINKFTTDGGDNILNLEDWKKLTKQDLNSIISSPDAIFQNPATNNYHLIKGCDAIDKGSLINAPLKDLDGVLRPFGNGIDIGAYEYTGTNGLEERQTIAVLQIYPNPVKDYIIVHAKDNIKKIEITDMLGRNRIIVDVYNSNNEVVTVSELEKGTYIIQAFCSHGNTFLSKFIK